MEWFESAELFRDFLSDRDLLYAFNDNFNIEFSKPDTWLDYENLKDFLIKNGPMAYLSYAFSWESTFEGHNFWEEINNEWISYLEEL